MTKPHTLLLVSVMSLMHTTTSRAGWEPVAPLPEPNGGFVAGCVRERIIIAGGTTWRDDTKHWLDTVHALDPATGKWSTGPKLPHPIAYAACGSDGEKLYFAGGADGTRARTELYALDADLKLSKLGDLPRPVAFASAAVRGGELYTFAGSPDPDDWSKVTADLGAINLATGSFSSLPPYAELKHGCGIPAMVAAGNQLLSFTGAWLNPATKEVANMSEAFAYDIESKAWMALPPFHKPVRGLNAVALDEKHVYLAGGYGTDAEEFLDEALIYYGGEKRYAPAKPMPFKALTSLVKCGGYVYALGGEDRKKHRTDQCWRVRVEELLK